MTVSVHPPVVPAQSARSQSVHPQAQALLDGKAALGAPPLWEQTTDEARDWAGATTAVIPAGPDLESVRNVVVPSRAGGLRARLYSPTPSAPGIVLYCHSGGWVLGSVESDDSTARALAVASGCDVLSVAYRLAPEHIFPAATDDVYDALTWLCSPEGLADGRPVTVAGDSAGGNLAAVTALRARDAGGPAVALQVLVYPAVDCDLDRPSYLECDGDELMLNRRDMMWFWNRYAPAPSVRLNPYASPLRARDLSGLPPAYLVTAGFDPLRDEGLAYAARLRAAGVPVEQRHFESQVHGFFAFPGLLDDADRAVAEIGSAIATACADRTHA